MVITGCSVSESGRDYYRGADWDKWFDNSTLASVRPITPRIGTICPNSQAGINTTEVHGDANNDVHFIQLVYFDFIFVNASAQLWRASSGGLPV